MSGRGGIQPVVEFSRQVYNRGIALVSGGVMRAVEKTTWSAPSVAQVGILTVRLSIVIMREVLASIRDRTTWSQ